MGAAITIGIIAIVVMVCACFAPVAEESAEKQTPEPPMTFEEMQAAFNGEDVHSEEYTK